MKESEQHRNIERGGHQSRGLQCASMRSRMTIRLFDSVKLVADIAGQVFSRLSGDSLSPSWLFDTVRVVKVDKGLGVS